MVYKLSSIKITFIGPTLKDLPHAGALLIPLHSLPQEHQAGEDHHVHTCWLQPQGQGQERQRQERQECW